MIKPFNEPIQEREYLRWLDTHMDTGYVANRWRDGQVRFHHADCWTLTAQSNRKTTKQYSKLCGTNLRELQGHVKNDWNSEDTIWCSKCGDRGEQTKKEN